MVFLSFQGSLLADAASNASSGLHALNIRGKQQYIREGFSVDIHEELLAASASKGVALPGDDLRAARLTYTLCDAATDQAVARLDRFAIGYTTDSGSISVGRQAYSLGNGLVFSVHDLLNPFSPLAVDKDYKPGDDMVIGSLNLLPTGVTEFVAALRREAGTQDLTSEASSGLIVQKARIDSLMLDSHALFGGDAGDILYGFGAARDLFGATVRGDYLLRQRNQDTFYSTALLNADAGFGCLSRNCYGFIEYFYSGVGAQNENYYAPSPLQASLVQAGKLYTLGKNYLSYGGRIEATPLTNIYLSHILNLQDRSSVLQGRMSIDLLQDVVFQIGAIVPMGSEGDEFGEVPALPFVAIRRQSQYFFRLEYYL